MAVFNGNGTGNNYVGGNANDSIYGNNGNDTLYGGGGHDLIDGGNQNDLLTGGAGNDTLIGGNGTDTASFADLTGYVRVDLTAGTALNYANLGSLLGTDSLSGIENVVGTAGRDYIKGSAGNNLLTGGGDNDEFTITSGVDTIDGGAGSDSLVFTGGAATVNLASGTYWVNSGTNGTIISVDHAAGGNDNDTISGNANRNVLEGKAGNDVISNVAGGEDYLMGGSGSDRLIYTGGTVVMSGDSDYLDGPHGSAADVFQINAAAGNVTIWDFEHGVDKLDLTAFGFDGNGVSTYWTGSAAYGSTQSTLTLTGQNSEVVNIQISGSQGYQFSLSDMINGSSSLLPPAPQYPINGGNGVADVFTIVAQDGFDQTFNNFENGLDKMDIRGIDLNYWSGYLSNVPGGTDTVLEFYGTNGEEFTVTLPGMPYWDIDPSDYIM